MSTSVFWTAVRGGLAGAAGSVVQAAVGKSEDIAILPPRENANIAPRLMDRLFGTRGISLTTAESWTLGTIFHLGYGAGWGKLYALVRERRPTHPLLGGTILGTTIYLITFPRWGGAVLSGIERPPERRSRRMGFVAASVALSFGLATALFYEAIRDDG
jgi:hypothetical protein